MIERNHHRKIVVKNHTDLCDLLERLGWDKCPFDYCIENQNNVITIKGYPSKATEKWMAESSEVVPYTSIFPHEFHEIIGDEWGLNFFALSTTASLIRALEKDKVVQSISEKFPTEITMSMIAEFTKSLLYDTEYDPQYSFPNEYPLLGLIIALKPYIQKDRDVRYFYNELIGVSYPPIHSVQRTIHYIVSEIREI